MTARATTVQLAALRQAPIAHCDRTNRRTIARCRREGWLVGADGRRGLQWEITDAGRAELARAERTP